MVIVLGVVVLFLVAGIVGRRRGKRRMAGLDSSTPQFFIAPPTRWSTTGRDHRL